MEMNVDKDGVDIKSKSGSIHFMYLFSQCVFSKSLQLFLNLGGDTPFCLISRRNQRFLFDG